MLALSGRIQKFHDWTGEWKKRTVPGRLRLEPGWAWTPLPRSMPNMIHFVREDEVPEAAVLQLLDTNLARRILQAAPTILYVYDVQKERSVFQNRSIGDLLGHKPMVDGGPSNGWAAFIHPEDKDRFPNHRARLKKIRPGETLFWEFRAQNTSGQWRWFLSRDTLMSSDDSGEPLLVVGSASDITEQKQAEQHKELLADEMRHRARNLVAIVQAIARMSRPKNQPEANKYIDTFMGRLLTLLNTGGIVLSSALRLADFGAVVDSTLAPFRDVAGKKRITTEGPIVDLPERTAGGLAMAIHELATNAVKYGALSIDTGSVYLQWTLTDLGGQKHFTMLWKETGGPAVSTPTSEGFGGMVIRQSVAHEIDSKLSLLYLPEGLSCSLGFRISES